MNESDTRRVQVKQIIFLVLVVVSLLLILGMLLTKDANAGDKKVLKLRHKLRFSYRDARVRYRDSRDCDRDLRERAERRYLRRRNDESITRTEGDYELDRREVLEGNLVVLCGDAKIAGEVTGTILVVCGDAILRSTAEVDGDVISIGGDVRKSGRSRIRGDIIETSPRSLTRSTRSRSRRTRSWRNYYRSRVPSFKAQLHYNRVDGLFIGGALPRRYNSMHEFDIFGFGGYGFAGKRWQYQIGGEYYIGREFRFALGAEAHDFTDSEDEWVISKAENSLAAALINEDFQDYYRRQGFSLFASQNFTEGITLTGGYRRDDLIGLSNKTDWALFAKKKDFRINPFADEGRLVSYFAELKFDTRDRDTSPRHGWFLKATAEFSRPDFDSEFDYDRIIIDLRRYQPVGYGKNLDIRLRAGSARGIMPEQFLFDLGGLSTLRGYRFKEFTGDRMVLGNVEYRLGAGTSRLSDIPILGAFNLILFADVGAVWAAEDNSQFDASFDYLTFGRLKSNLGVAITDAEGRVRLNFARRMDKADSDIVVTFRLNRAF